MPACNNVSRNLSTLPSLNRRIRTSAGASRITGADGAWGLGAATRTRMDTHEGDTGIVDHLPKDVPYNLCIAVAKDDF